MKVVHAFDNNKDDVEEIINKKKAFADFGFARSKKFIGALLEEIDLIPLKITSFIRRIQEKNGRVQYTIEKGFTKTNHIRLAKCSNDMSLMDEHAAFTLIPGQKSDSSDHIKEKFIWTLLHELTHWVHRTDDNIVKKREATLSGALKKGKWYKKFTHQVHAEYTNADSWTEIIFQIYHKTARRKRLL